MSDRTGWPGRPGPPHGHPCPECGALRAPDNTPSCSCARRASDALRDTRTAEAAAAEDFDPLRIRPYVELGGTTEPGPGDGGAGTANGRRDRGAGADRASAGNAVDATMTLRAVPGADPTAPPGASPAPDETMRLQRIPPGTAGFLPGAADETRPLRRIPSDAGGIEASPFEGAEAAGRPRPGDEGPVRGRRRRVLVIAAAGAAVAVVAAAGFASGLFTYEKPTRDEAAPKDVRASVPDSSTGAASASAPSDSATPSESSGPPPSERSEHPSPTPTESSAPPSAAPSATASTTAPTARATGTIGADSQADDGRQTIASPVLRLGDKGDEVTELQLRLRQLYLYNGEANGTFTSEVETALRNYQWSRGLQEDELGVYGAATRASLESETKEP
ncbi:peptidoglycan-binding protein [Streptomyces sp. NPDC005811]|uniref:peptidoglycan-binding protein n=1 Tax=Streptomyces sp. NPDC005811 TaxID=3154565 RepID=UPI0033D5B965